MNVLGVNLQEGMHAQKQEGMNVLRMHAHEQGGMNVFGMHLQEGMHVHMHQQEDMNVFGMHALWQEGMNVHICKRACMCRVHGMQEVHECITSRSPMDASPVQTGLP